MRHIGEFGKVVRQIHGNELPCGHKLGLVTIQYPAMDRVYTIIAYIYEFYG